MQTDTLPQPCDPAHAWVVSNKKPQEQALTVPSFVQSSASNTTSSKSEENHSDKDKKNKAKKRN